MAEYPLMGLAETHAKRVVKVERAETTFGVIATEFLSKRAKEGLTVGALGRAMTGSR